MKPLSTPAALFVTVNLAAMLGPVRAQTVRGQLIDANSGTPVPHAFIILADSTGSELLRALSDAQGSFLIEAPGPGFYRLRTAIIGLRSWTSPTFPLAEGETFAYRIEVPLESVRLEALVVEGTRECQVAPDSGHAVSIVWEEAKKALAAVNWTRDSAPLSFQAIEFNRDLHPQTLRSLGGRANRQSGIANGSPFTSAPAEELSELGYVRAAEEGGWKSYGPDAAVLLSDTFANDHCFTLQPHPDMTDLIGLAFQPTSTRDVPDIRGVMWLDRESAQLLRLEFQYDPLPWPVALRHAGGEVYFERLPNGLWFVSQWRLRLPRLSRQSRGSSLGQYRIQAYTETGGYVIQLRHPNGELLTRDLTAPPDARGGRRNAGPRGRPIAGGVAGAVTNVYTGATVSGAAVLLLDSVDVVHAMAVSDSAGRFFAQTARAGAFRLAIHRRGYQPTTSSPIDIPSGIVVTTRINLNPSAVMESVRDSASYRRFGDVRPQYRFTRDDIERAGATDIFELALTIAGTQALGPLETPRLVLNDVQCPPRVFVDGRPTAASEVLHRTVDGWVELVEISLSPSDTPPEFRSEEPDRMRCGTILIWSAQN